MSAKRYPKIFIQSKNELAKHISYANFSKDEALALINDVIANFDGYWRDNKKLSDVERGKYVRGAKGTPLGRFLNSVNKQVLTPHDKSLPLFIFGGVSKRDHVQAVETLLGDRRQRTLLQLDITSFFEQIDKDRVYHFFADKCECSHKAARLLSDLCCVPLGAKDNPEAHASIARGFATSPRLAIWCNLDTFVRLEWLVKKRLKGKDPRIAIYVDDIGITASKVSKNEMERLYIEIEQLFQRGDKNQTLPLNREKKHIFSHEKGLEHLGIKMHRNRLELGSRSKSKLGKTKSKLGQDLSTKERDRIRDRRRSLMQYKNYVEKSVRN